MLDALKVPKINQILATGNDSSLTVSFVCVCMCVWVSFIVCQLKYFIIFGLARDTTWI